VWFWPPFGDGGFVGGGWWGLSFFGAVWGWFGGVVLGVLGCWRVGVEVWGGVSGGDVWVVIVFFVVVVGEFFFVVFVEEVATFCS